MLLPLVSPRRICRWPQTSSARRGHASRSVGQVSGGTVRPSPCSYVNLNFRAMRLCVTFQSDQWDIKSWQTLLSEAQTQVGLLLLLLLVAGGIGQERRFRCTSSTSLSKGLLPVVFGRAEIRPWDHALRRLPPVPQAGQSVSHLLPCMTASDPSNRSQLSSPLSSRKSISDDP